MNAIPPVHLTRLDYRIWLDSIESSISEFYDYFFDWYDKQLRRSLPEQVMNDSEQLFVDVGGARSTSIELEESGEIEEGDAVGFDAYGIIASPLSVGLETALFYFGKPIGRSGGTTYPVNDVFSRCQLSIETTWGEGNYLSTSLQSGGGLVRDLYDFNTVLVRGNAIDGYLIVSSFLKQVPGMAQTATKSQIFATMLKQHDVNQIEFRHFLRRRGQSYKALGLEYGRRQFAFSEAKFRLIEKHFKASVIELNATGKIRENRPT